MPPATPFRRADMLDRLEAESFDVLVIGGGITGGGVALDAATRGLRTALVERDDFASGTSSKSSKLVHGGLRYLQQGDVRLVYEALARAPAAAPQRPAPGASVLPFLIPILTKDGVVIAQDRPGARLGDVDVRPHRRLAHRQAPPAGSKKDAAFAHLPTMPRRAPRLRLPLLRRHRRRRPARASRSPAPPRPTAPSSPTAAAVVDVDQGRRRSRSTAPWSTPAAGASQSRATVVVNAAGVWADDVRALDEGADPDSIRPAKGVHITVPWEQGAQRHRRRHPGAQGQAQPVRRAVGPKPTARSSTPTSAPPTPTTTGRSTTRSAPTDDIAYVLARAQRTRSPTGDHRATTSPARGPGCGRSCKRRAVGPHRRPVAPPQRHARSASRRRHASPAASSRRTARWPPTPSTRCCDVLGRRGRAAAPSALPLLGADGLPRAARRASPTPTSPAATARRPARSRR